MDNISDWIYIVFIIIAGISGLFSGTKKKKRSIEVLGKPEKNVISTERQPRSEQPMRPPSPQKAMQQKVAIPSVTPSPTSKVKKTNSFLSEKHEITSPSIVPMETKALEMEEESCIGEEFRPSNLEDMKKAIVYAEILNRKYS